MEFLAKPTDVTKVEADLVAVFSSWAKASKAKAWEDVALSDEAKKLDRALGGMLSEVGSAENFEAKQGNTLLIHSHGKVPAKRLLLVGLGKIADLTMANWQTAAAKIARRAKAVSAKRIAIALSSDLLDHLESEKAAQGCAEGVTLGAYTFLKHKGREEQEKERHIERVWLLASANRLNAVAFGIKQGEIISQAVSFARDLVNEPPSRTTPTYLGDVAKRLAKGRKDITCEVLGKPQIETLRMGGLLGISRGSSEEPKFIKLVYRGGGRKTIVLVGKGITFDTGGLSLKTSSWMETMKLDMAGAATILGVFHALSNLKPRVNVVGLISATENMPGPDAIKPGDVVCAMNGKSIEILNTDAEGRVVLADALSYAVLRLKPDVLIDLATLTGACVVALGEEITGLFSNTQKLTDALTQAAKRSGEKVWELPLVKDYKEQLKSTVADIKNTQSSRYGGAITAALFLQEFVPDSVPWAHLDIAGPSFTEKDAPLTPAGGTGFGVRMLLEYIHSL